MDHILDKTRLTLYYDQYKYKVHFIVPGIQYFRNIKSVNDMSLRLAHDVLNSERQPYSSFTSNRFGATTHLSRLQFKRLDDILKNNFSGEKVIKDYFLMYEKLIANSTDSHKIAVSANSVIIYTNSETLISDIKVQGESIQPKSYYVETKPDYVKGKIYHKSPTHKYRVYFSLKRLTDKESANRFRDFINTNDCKPSYSLQRELNAALYDSRMIRTPYLMLVSNHYIDINDEKIITMLALTFGDYVSKVSDIVQR